MPWVLDDIKKILFILLDMIYCDYVLLMSLSFRDYYIKVCIGKMLPLDICFKILKEKT